MLSLFHCTACGQIFDNTRRPYSGTKCSHSICALCFKDRTSDNCACGEKNSFTNATINYNYIDFMEPFEMNPDLQMFFNSVKDSYSGLCAECRCKDEHGKLYLCVNCCKEDPRALDDSVRTLNTNLENFLSKTYCSNCACDFHRNKKHNVEALSKMLLVPGQTDLWKMENIWITEPQVEQETYLAPWGNIIKFLKSAVSKQKTYQNEVCNDPTGILAPLKNRITLYHSAVADEYYEKAKKVLNDPKDQNKREEYLKVANELETICKEFKEFSMEPAEIRKVDQRVAEQFQEGERKTMENMKNCIEQIKTERNLFINVWGNNNPRQFETIVILNEIDALAKFNKDRLNIAEKLHQNAQLDDNYRDAIDAEIRAIEWQLLIRLMILKHFPNSPRNNDEEYRRLIILEDKFLVLYRDEERQRKYSVLNLGIGSKLLQ